MKTVINITIGGLVFAIEQDAYDSLEKYIKEIKQTLVEGDDVNEIVSDIETAIAEKLSERGRSERIAVTEDDINKVILEMGAPIDFKEAGGVEGESAQSETEDKKDEIKKRLYRDTDDVVIAGVASGIAKYFDIDPAIVRIIFVAALFFNGIGIIAYLIFWLAVPVAKTTTEKYAMSGDKVTLKEITERVKKNINDIDKEDLEKARGLWNSLLSGLKRIFSLIGICIKVLFSILRYVVGFSFLLAGSFAMAGLVSALVIILFVDNASIPQSIQPAMQLVLSSPLGVISIVSVFLTAVIPFVVLLLAGGSLISKRIILSVTKSITLAAVWIVALVLAITTSAVQIDRVLEKVGPINVEDNDFMININRSEEGIKIDVTDKDRKQNSKIEVSEDVAPNLPKIEIYSGLSFTQNSTVINLARKGLEGSLKAEVGQFVALTELDISNNNFTDLPAEIGQLSQLQVLNLSNNNFTGLPHELGNLENLQVLDLRGNNISKFDLQIIREKLGEEVTVVE
ncbi:PspC domain-containing protein [Candidatus Nomurabacteria bacterium]|nr:PspC domain-containing protein [Candidatus Kaiserbacteria bacterium]MCB9814638.1 PspC domain-containing protein [Candidatus Nomurabacteria bacterium]